MWEGPSSFKVYFTHNKELLKHLEFSMDFRHRHSHQTNQVLHDPWKKVLFDLENDEVLYGVVHAHRVQQLSDVPSGVAVNEAAVNPFNHVLSLGSRPL